MCKCDRCNKTWLSSTEPSRLRYWSSDFEFECSSLPTIDTKICPECGIDLINFLRAPTTDSMEDMPAPCYQEDMW